MSSEPHKGGEGRLRSLWKSLTGKNSAQGLRIIVLLLFCIACVAIVLPVALRPRFPSILAVPVSALLLLSLAAKVFVVRDFYHKIALYVVDSILLVLFNVFAGWEIDSLVRQASYSYLIYVCVLSEYYLSAPTLRDDAIMFGVNLAAYTVVYVINAVQAGEIARAFDLSSQYFVGLIVIVLHFIMFGFAMTLARKNRQIEENLREIEESRNELMRAYEKVEEATVIEERNRIAKEIHDTAGHSLTTVIMQTEAARLALGKDDAEAKRCIAAANLQAKKLPRRTAPVRTSSLRPQRGHLFPRLSGGDHRRLLRRHRPHRSQQDRRPRADRGSRALHRQYPARGHFQRRAARRQYGVPL